jgi:CRP-like cAMP-binding protein
MLALEAVTDNRLLWDLPPQERALVHMHLEPMSFEIGCVLHRAGERVGYAFLPASGIIALIASTAEGRSIDVGMVGHDGMFGEILISDHDVEMVSVLVRGRGTGWRIKARGFRQMIAQCPTLARRVERFAFTRMAFTVQTAACNASHSIESRAARIMLAFSSHMGRADFELTQRHLADMLGVRRSAISQPAQALGRENLIEYTRGQMRIRDHAGLTSVACSCHPLMEAILQGH